MLSRIAETLYWIGRYIERAENTARLLSVNYLALMEAPLVPGARGIVTEQWAPLLSITGDEESFRQHFERADAGNVSTWLAIHPNNPSSIRSTLAFARENARSLRDRISTEMWEAINRTYHALCLECSESLEEDRLFDYCVSAREASHLFFGIADATMPRDLGWHFMRAGQYLERADNTIRTLRVPYRQYRGQAPVAEGIEAHRGMALLKSLSAYEAFRKRYRTQLEARLIAEFLLLDAEFPRSVRFALQAVNDILAELAIRNQGSGSEAQRHSGWLAAQLAYRQVSDILEAENPGLDTLLDDIATLSESITVTHFAAKPLYSSQSQTAHIR